MINSEVKRISYSHYYLKLGLVLGLEIGRTKPELVKQLLECDELMEVAELINDELQTHIFKGMPLYEVYTTVTKALNASGSKITDSFDEAIKVVLDNK